MLCKLPRTAGFAAQRCNGRTAAFSSRSVQQQHRLPTRVCAVVEADAAVDVDAKGARLVRQPCFRDCA
jgi:hypothetical protein